MKKPVDKETQRALAELKVMAAGACWILSSMLAATQLIDREHGTLPAFIWTAALALFNCRVVVKNKAVLAGLTDTNDKA